MSDPTEDGRRLIAEIESDSRKPLDVNVLRAMGLKVAEFVEQAARDASGPRQIVYDGDPVDGDRSRMATRSTQRLDAALWYRWAYRGHARDRKYGRREWVAVKTHAEVHREINSDVADCKYCDLSSRDLRDVNEFECIAFVLRRLAGNTGHQVTVSGLVAAYRAQNTCRGAT